MTSIDIIIHWNLLTCPVGATVQSSNIMPLGFQQHPKQPKEPWFYYVLLKDFTGVYTKPGLSHSFNGRTEGNLLLVCQHPRTRSPNERGPIFSRSAVSSALASEIPPMPTTYARHEAYIHIFHTWRVYGYAIFQPTNLKC